MRTGSLRTDAALDSSATAAFKARLIKVELQAGSGQHYAVIGSSAEALWIGAGLPET